MSLMGPLAEITMRLMQVCFNPKEEIGRRVPRL
jgi:hypothetical protein